jgi:hypothetical protein
MRRPLSLMVLILSMPQLVSAQLASPPPAAPNPMVWQEGINKAENWRILGCPHNYSSDAELEQMKRSGQCKNVDPATGELLSESQMTAPDTTPNWKRLGCPRDYESDADLAQMQRDGLCKPAKG